MKTMAYIINDLSQKGLAFSTTISIPHPLTPAAGDAKATRDLNSEIRLRRINQARQRVYTMPFAGSNARLRNSSFTTASFTSILLRRSVVRRKTRKRER